MALSENMQGALLMSASMAGFALNDTAMKLAGDDLGFFQTIFIRGIFTIVLIGSFAYLRGALNRLPPVADLRLIGLRSVAEIGGTLAFLTALFHMPLANITAILQFLPLSIALGAALFMGEPIGRRRVVAIGLGFAGVMIIIRPGTEGFNAYALLGLVAVAFVTLRDLAARKFSPAVSSLFAAFVASVVITLTALAGLAFGGEWHPVPTRNLVLLVIASGFLFIGYYCSVAAMRVGEIGMVTSYRYSIMIWAVVLGWLFFGDIPDFWTVVGMIIVLVTGLFMAWREALAARKKA